jgi:hypothetical protein
MAQIEPAPVQLARLETGPPAAAAVMAMAATPSATIAGSPPVASGGTDSSPAAGFALLLFLAAVLLALAFAAIPERMLSTVSVRLAESRQEIGLGLVVGIAAGALISIILLEAGS